MKSVNNIKLEGERSTHLHKRLNRLSSSKFFAVLYRTGMGKMLLVNLIILLCCLPAYYVLAVASGTVSSFSSALPSYGSFGITSGLWIGVDSYITTNSLAIYQACLWKCALGGLMLTFVLSGVLAIIRDAFWVGNLKVFSCFAGGVKANFVYALISSIIISAMVAGIVSAYWFVYPTLAVWAGIMMLIAMVLVAVFVTMYLFVLCSVTVTYKQSIGRSLLDSWNMLLLNIMPNIFKFFMAMLPVLLLFVLTSTLQSLVVIIMLMFGLFYIPFVWQTHMMQVFALFHPIEAIKKKDAKAQSAQTATA